MIIKINIVDAFIVGRSGGGLRRRKRVQQGVCGVSVQLRTPKRRRSRETVQAKRKSTIGEKSVEIYSREKAFSPTAVVIKTNPLFQCSGTPLRIPSNKEVSVRSLVIKEYRAERSNTVMHKNYLFLRKRENKVFLNNLSISTRPDTSER